MPDIVIKTEMMTKLLERLNPNKATGPDDVHDRILQLAVNELATVLQLFLNKLIQVN